MRIGQDDDRFNFTAGDYSESMLLASQWTPHWATSVSGNFYQRGGINAGKFLGSVTRRQVNWGALTVGAGVSHDNAIIPRSEAFFETDHGWRINETNFVRSTEFIYGQHWYWYQGARILTLKSMLIVFLPRDWTFIRQEILLTNCLSGQTSHCTVTNVQKRLRQKPRSAQKAINYWNSTLHSSPFSNEMKYTPRKFYNFPRVYPSVGTVPPGRPLNTRGTSLAEL